MSDQSPKIREILDNYFRHKMNEDMHAIGSADPLEFSELPEEEPLDEEPIVEVAEEAPKADAKKERVSSIMKGFFAGKVKK